MNTGTHKKPDRYLPSDWRFLLLWHFGVIPLGIIATIFVIALNKSRQGDTTLIWVALAIGIVGTILLFFARLPLYRQHKYLSIGPRELPERHKILYWIAYGFIGTCILILISILIVLK